MRKVCHKFIEVRCYIVVRVQGLTGNYRCRLNSIQTIANWPPGLLPASACFETLSGLFFNWSVMLALILVS